MLGCNKTNSGFTFFETEAQAEGSIIFIDIFNCGTSKGVRLDLLGKCFGSRLLLGRFSFWWRLNCDRIAIGTGSNNRRAQAELAVNGGSLDWPRRLE
jgi:hypothetical protein